ncbi:conserved hypothetical protein [Leishmania major strain Friedlin]|uniref:Transmembrane protein n=1 Tax=Leishmania major TaxID=5664 RepID=Q4Q8U5_LEIMA|nr:conserved hypothetical protein [Leishmania major strain Friedlin]CAG9576573.1 hypothetical_protein_-_conserved [Leishmania major strain Friedlin]CAJ05618.1 conserved hypothetical protein [Leishmania major strain Friedlin]|eukprot:XP_001684253.1 conserved hypothetical protein [Leishmania major strain Friedlin]
MLLHRRAALLLWVRARRTAVLVGSSSLSATAEAAAAFSSATTPPQRRNVGSASGAVDSHVAAVPAAGGPASAAAAAGAAPQYHSHDTPLQEHPRQAAYSKGGYPLIGRLRTSGHGLTLGRVQAALTVYVLAASVGLLYVLYYLTTDTYVLTTNVSPYRHSLFFHFPCDMAILENRLTHKRHTVEVVPAAGAPHPLVDDNREVDHAGFARPKPAVVERRLHINAVLHRVFLYLQKTESLVTVDAQAEMAPYRFMDGANSLGKASRASVGFLRKDQLLPDINDHRASTASSQRRWWQWWGRGASTAAAPLPLSASGSSAYAATATEVPATPTAPTKILLRSSVRLRDSMNGYQKGHISTYEQLIHHLAQENIKQRYYAYVLARGMAKSSGLRKAYAEQLIRNGLISGDGVKLTELVPDVQRFADEVFAQVRERFGDDVIVYEYTATMW